MVSTVYQRGTRDSRDADRTGPGRAEARADAGRAGSV